MYLIGYDIGSSSVKASIIDGATGKAVASAFYPKAEMKIIARQNGWAEQNPEDWWENLKLATKDVLSASKVKNADIKAIGISYQMHGLVIGHQRCIICFKSKECRYQSHWYFIPNAWFSCS